MHAAKSIPEHVNSELLIKAASYELASILNMQDLVHGRVASCCNRSVSHIILIILAVSNSRL